MQGIEQLPAQEAKDLLGVEMSALAEAEVTELNWLDEMR
jgi:hypothetical protein